MRKSGILKSEIRTLFAPQILILLFILASCINSASASLLKDDRTLSVTGQGIVAVKPDLAKLNLGVEVIRKTAQDAQSENAGIMQKVVEAALNLGIPKDKIATSSLNIWPENKYEANQPPKIVGYRCSNQVNIIIEDIGKVSKVLDAGISAGATNVNGINFSLKDDLEAKKNALDKAVKEADAKAKAIAAAAGQKIKGIQSIIESGAVFIPPSNQEFAAKAMALGGGGNKTPVSAGLIEVRGNVSISYILE